MRAKRITATVVAAAFALSLAGCDGMQQRGGGSMQGMNQSSSMSGTGQGALIGGGVGAIAGALAGKNKLLGALIGGVGGAVVGALIGHYIDTQKATREEAIQVHAKEYKALAKEPADRNLVKIEKASLTPSPVKPGDKVVSKVEYTVLSREDGTVKISEKRTITDQYGESVTIEDKKIEVSRDQDAEQGTKISECEFVVPSGLEPGTYKMITEISDGTTKTHKENKFRVI